MKSGVLFPSLCVLMVSTALLSQFQYLHLTFEFQYEKSTSSQFESSERVQFSGELRTRASKKAHRAVVGEKLDAPVRQSGRSHSGSESALLPQSVTTKGQAQMCKANTLPLVTDDIPRN